jgi:hypothetical protein
MCFLRQLMQCAHIFWTGVINVVCYSVIVILSVDTQR